MRHRFVSYYYVLHVCLLFSTTDNINEKAMAGFLAKQFLKLEHQGMDKYDGSYGAYLKSLPFELGKNEQDHVLWWSEMDVENLLRGSLAYEDTIGIREEVQ